MRIAIIGQKGIPAVSGGVEKHVEELATRLAKRGHQVYVYTRPNYTDKSLKTYKGVNLISLPNLKTKHLDAISHTFMASLDAVFKRKPDVIHFHSIGPSSLILLVKLLKPRTPVIATFHTQCYYHQKWGLLAKTYLKLGEYICCKLADKTITVSKTLKKYTEEKYSKEAMYIPNGVESPETAQADLIKTWGLEKDNYILSVSRLVRHKGIHYLIEAYKGLDTDKKLVIVGDSSYTDSYVDELKQAAKDNKNIIFTGAQSGQTLAELFTNAYLFVQPSDSEGLSIALLEAMSYSKAALVSDIPENMEAIEAAGISFKQGDISDLKAKLEAMLNEPLLVLQKGNAAVVRVKREYDWENIVDSVIDAYTTSLKDYSLWILGLLRYSRSSK